MTPRIFARREVIDGAVRRIATAIEADHRGGTPPLLLGVLKGSFVFLADLVRAMTLSCEVDFVRVRSYLGRERGDTTSLAGALPASVEGRRVVIVEDILDSGRTASFLLDALAAAGAERTRLCALLVRPGSQCKADYWGLEAPPGFVVGYGLDLDERYRGMPDLAVLPDSS